MLNLFAVHEPFDTASAQSPRGDAAKALARRAWPYLAAAIVTAAALIVALLIKTHVFVANLALVFLAGVVFCAARWSLKPALLACLLSVLSLNFFFFPPIHNFSVRDPENLVAVLVFVGVAVFVGRLTARARADATLAERRAAVTNTLYVFTRKIAELTDLEAVVNLTARQLAETLGLHVCLLLLEQDILTIRAFAPLEGTLSAEDMARAETLARRDKATIVPKDVAGTRRYGFIPMHAASGTVGLIGLSLNDQQVPVMNDDDQRFAEAVADQVAVAVERLTLTADVERARLAAETEGLRSAMLSAISHDLKTPLASILGAATSLGTYDSYFEQQEREELVATIREEALRMNRFVGNLLDITRVESGTLEVRAEATEIEEVIGAAARRARRILGDHRLNLQIAPDLPMLQIDGVLLEQALFNLLDNAAKYSPPQSTIIVDARRVFGRIMIKVIDEGPGIHPKDINRIFEKFYRSGHGRRQRAGTGLGLAICRGFVEAMHGRIIAGNRTDRSGAVFMIGFPQPIDPPHEIVSKADDD